MNRPHDSARTAATATISTISTISVENAPLQNYLDRLYAPLIEVMPYADRQAARIEVEGHILHLIEAEMSIGLSLDAATESALEQFGDPGVLGRAIARTARSLETSTERPSSSFLLTLGLSALTVANVALSELVYIRQYLDSGTDVPVAPLVAWLIVSPLLAGLLVAWIAPKAGPSLLWKTLVRAILCWTALALLLDLLHAPQSEIILFAVSQLYLLAASVAASRLAPALRRFIRVRKLSHR